MTELSEYAKYNKYMGVLEDERSSWDVSNKDISTYILPSRGRWLQDGNEPNYGGNKHEDVYNEVGIHAIRIPVAGMIHGLSSPVSDWFQFSIGDKDLMKFGPVKKHLGIMADGYKALFQKSNFYTSLYVIYEEEIGFGQAVALIDEDFETLIHFNVLTAGEYVLNADNKKRINTLGRRYFSQLGSMADKFGIQNLSEGSQSEYKTNPFAWKKVMHFVEPNKKHDDRMLDSFAYDSIYFETGKDEPLLKSGYHEKPFVSPRFRQTAENVYGYGLGRDTIGGIKGIQSMEEDSYLAISRGADPPLMGHSSFINMLDTSAGAFNPVSDAAKMEGLRSIYEKVDFDHEAVETKIERVEGKVSTGFFNDLFLYLMNNPNATATEILERKAEKVILLGPVITRQQTELFQPTFERVHGIATRANYFPPPPPELEGHELEIEYISQLAIAQRMSMMDSVYAYIGLAGQLQTLDMNHPVNDNVDVDKVMEESSERLGVMNMTRGSDERKERRRERAEQIKQETAIAQAREVIGGIKDASEIQAPNAG